MRFQGNKKGIYIANSAKDFQNNAILSVSEVSEQKGFFWLQPSELQTFNSVCGICYISPIKKISHYERFFVSVLKFFSDYPPP